LRSFPFPEGSPYQDEIARVFAEFMQRVIASENRAA